MKKAGGAFAPPARLLTRTAQNCGSEPAVSGQLQLAHADSVSAVGREASDLSYVGILDIVGRRVQVGVVEEIGRIHANPERDSFREAERLHDREVLLDHEDVP